MPNEGKSERSGSSWSKIFLWASFGILLLATGAGTWHGYQRAGVAELLEDAKSARQAWAETVSHRPPLRLAGTSSTVRSENAWDHYLEAASITENHLYPSSGPGLGPSSEAKAIAEALRRGARSRIAKPPDVRTVGRAFTELSITTFAVEICADQAIWQHHDAAVDHCMTACWFGADCIPVFGTFILDRSIRYAAEIGAALPATSRQRMLEVLRRLEIPSAGGMALTAQIRALSWALEGESHPHQSVLRKIQFQINQPIYLWDLLSAQASLLPQRQLITAPWPEVQRWNMHKRNPAQLSRKFELTSPLPHIKHIIRNHRRTVTRFRLLLCALQGGRNPGIDPFGDGKATLRSRQEGDQLILWGAGRDGTDDGGIPNRVIPGFERHKDIVLVFTPEN